MIFTHTCACLAHLIVVLCLYHKVVVQAEVFTAIADVERLLETHQRIIDDVNFYIQSEEERLNTLKKFINIYMAEHKKAMEDVPNYLGNPINAFTLIKRLTKDLDFIEKVIQMGTVNVQNITLNHRDMKYPSYEDLTGAAQALTRLQETYKLDLHELSAGVLNGVAYSTPMSTGDCYELGIALYNDKAFKDALPWLMEAQRKYRDETGPHHITESDIVEYIGATHYYLGNHKIALELAKETLKMNPKNPHARGNIILYQKAIAEQEAKEIISQLGGEINDETTKSPLKDELRLEYEEEIKDYEVLCRGEMEVPPALAKRLHCLYQRENHPFLRLAPIKVEYVYLQPDIVIFHDVMSDTEIQFIKEAAQPRFGRATIKDIMTGALIPVKYRISKSAWLTDEESQVIRRVSMRVEDMTGLSVATAEDLQVVNYGIGGHYEPHFDFSRKQESPINFRNYGNRIGTVLFYMSDVAQGGATVFTKLGLSLFPIKGAAAFWYNLHPSGEGDLATRHAACPVLRGSKWVSNKWLHFVGQEFSRPCNLEYQDECVLGKIPKPVRKALK